jgi:hypothetical protein
MKNENKVILRKEREKREREKERKRMRKINQKSKQNVILREKRNEKE